MGDATVSEVEKSDNNSDATTPTLGEKREPIEDGNEENPKRQKITTEVIKPYWNYIFIIFEGI